MIEKSIDLGSFEITPKVVPKPIPAVIEKFIRETCTVGKPEKVWSDDLFLAYVKWIKQQGIDPLPRRAFVENVKRMGFRNYRSSKSRRRWQGLRLNAAA